MTTAPAMPDFAKTVNAVGIRSSAGFERPARKPNKIKVLPGVKINAIKGLTCAHVSSNLLTDARPSKPSR